jgi:hypothetical protein
MKKLNGFAVSWFFAPYVGSADTDFYKRIKNTDVSYLVAQVARDHRDARLLRTAGKADFERVEIKLDHNNPRTAPVRKKFVDEVVRIFEGSGRQFDFIISHSNELISHEAAGRIKEKNTSLPWVAYFGDLFARNPYIAHMRGYPLVSEDTLIEQETLRNADLIILNNEYQRELMFSGDFAQYAHKAVVIPHCYDPAMYEGQPVEGFDKFVFAHLGTLYHVKRTATPIMQAVDRLVEIYPAYKNKFEVRFYGGSPYPNDVDEHQRMRYREHVRFESAVSYFESLQLMQRANALLLIDGMFSENEDGIKANPFFPGKLADYMGAKKPIAAITMPVGPTADIMNLSGNLTADLRVDRIAYVMKRYLDGKVKPDISVYEQYSIDAIAPRMDGAIREILKG